MATVRMGQAEVARDLHFVFDRVRRGVEVVIESEHMAVAVIKPSAPARPGRKLSECIALAKAYEAKLGFASIPDEDFGKDVQESREALICFRWCHAPLRSSYAKASADWHRGSVTAWAAGLAR